MQIGAAVPLAIIASLTTTSAVAQPQGDRLARAFRAATGSTTLVLKERDGGETATTVPLRIVDTPSGPVLLTKREIADGCHACLGAIGVYYLRETGGRFAVRGRWPAAIPGWGWGAAPRWSVTNRFTANPAIYAEGGFTGQGITCTGATITELAADKPIQSDVVRTGLSNAGTAPESRLGGNALVDLKGRIAAIRKDHSFEVRVTGTGRFVEHYVKRGGKFVLVEPESRLSC